MCVESRDHGELLMATTTTMTPEAVGASEEGMTTVRLVVSCPDRPGIVAAISDFLLGAEANSVRSDQYSSDASGGAFLLRMEFTVPSQQMAWLTEHFGPLIGQRFNMNWRFPDRHHGNRKAVRRSAGGAEEGQTSADLRRTPGSRVERTVHLADRLRALLLGLPQGSPRVVRGQRRHPVARSREPF